jgi:hypothetical protein
VKHLSGTPFYGRLLALPTNITLCWKINVGEKHSSLLRKFINYGHKMFDNIGPSTIKKPCRFAMYGLCNKCFEKGTDIRKDLLRILSIFVNEESIILL